MSAQLAYAQTSSDSALRAIIESELEDFVARTELVEPLRAAVKHMLFPGGKRIRPFLTLTLAEDLGGHAKRLAPAAIALELLHTSSLIHDDLPAMDNDDFRRGKPTCHKAFGEACAVLAGDVLVAMALNCVAEAPFTTTQQSAFTSELSRTYIQLCNGQQLDILPPNQRGDLATIHRLKTGALFAAATAFAGIGMGYPEQLVGDLRELGGWMGLCFQITDDLIDARSEEKGRPQSSDARNAKDTFSYDQATAEMALDEAQRSLERCFVQVGQGVSRLGVVKASPTFSGTRAIVSQVVGRVQTSGK